MKHYDYIILGSGIAGLYAALLAREMGSVLILTKGSIDECNTRYAQGGIAAAVGRGDSALLHAQDTLKAGAGLCDPEAVRVLAEEAPDRITDLIRFGVPFDTQEGEVALAREAAHSLPRILHAGGDATGEKIELTLSGLARLSRVTILEYSLATRIVVEDNTATGVETLDWRLGNLTPFGCKNLILATGGAGRLFKVTTNPDVTTGDGVALAFQAGAEVTDMEFFQFHPTALHLPGVAPFLISEAVRGEGGVLRNEDGQAFMHSYHPDGDLAPRDIVARGILAEMQKTGVDHVHLDVTHLPSRVVTSRFPQIYRFCMEHGLDITTTPIPVAPAAHYMMGGVKTNLCGETNIRGLYAAGEVACTGLHGANRLASNSLMETIVYAKRVIQCTNGIISEPRTGGNLPEERHTLPERKGIARPQPLSLPALQSLMLDKVGMIRSGPVLEEAAETLAAWAQASQPPADRPSHELANLLLVGRLMTEAALLRTESRGAHYRTDFPQPSPQWLRHLVFTKE